MPEGVAGTRAHVPRLLGPAPGRRAYERRREGTDPGRRKIHRGEGGALTRQPGRLAVTGGGSSAPLLPPLSGQSTVISKPQ